MVEKCSPAPSARAFCARQPTRILVPSKESPETEMRGNSPGIEAHCASGAMCSAASMALDFFNSEKER